MDLLIAAGLAPSKAEARRLVTQKAVKVDGIVADNPASQIEIKKGTILKVGKHQLRRVA